MLTIIIIGLVAILGQPLVAQQSDLEVVRATLRSSYIKPIHDSILNLPSVDSIIKALADPFTYVAAPTTSAFLEDYYAHTSMDLGVDLDNGGDSLPLVCEAMYGTPAYYAGLCVGDTLYEIDNVSIRPMSWDQGMSAIISSKEKEVKLKVRRGDQNLTFYIPRIARTNTGYTYWIDNNIAYIRITHFGRTTGRSMLARFIEFKAARIRRIVLDLRPCSGGNLEQALIILRAFAEKGDTLMRTCFRGDSTVYTIAEHDGLMVGKPLELVVSRGTASAAEVIALAVQDYDYGYVMGDTTYGKGQMQGQLSLPSGNWFQFSTAVLKGGKGKGLCIDKVYGTGGLVPPMTFNTGTVSFDTLRALTAALKDLDEIRKRYAEVDTVAIRHIRKRLPDSLQIIGVYYILRSVWGEQGRLYFLSQQPRYARWKKPSAIVRSTR